jgi:NAD(P)-dependent dehydrogenase (short-subunit alcohol dehydrogenase family)
MQIDFSGKNILVTGAGKGIGRDIVQYLIRECNANVIALSRTQADLDSLREECDCEVVQVDLADVQATQRAIEAIDRVDLLVNNAGVAILEPFLTASVEAFDTTMAINVRAIMVVSQLVAQQMIDRGEGGAIVNVSSQASSRALQDHTTYCASKGAVDQLTRVMALELGPHQIRVNAVNPTVVLTPMGKRAWEDPAKGGPMKARIPLGRFAEPYHVSQVIAYLLSPHADMVNGITMPIDGGFLTT